MDGGMALVDVFRAIADAHRRELIRKLAAGSELPLHALMQGMDIGRTAVSKHLAVLKQAGIVSQRRHGRETLYRLNAAPLKQVYDWVSYYESFWRAQVLSLQGFLRKEGYAMKTLQLEFHLDAPVEAVWRALTESELLTQWMFFKENTFRAIVGHRFYPTSTLRSHTKSHEPFAHAGSRDLWITRVVSTALVPEVLPSGSSVVL